MANILIRDAQAFLVGYYVQPYNIKSVTKME